ncbi:hypothetical protein MAHJHV30_33070 [Mycobacterium avium subsp. hominissuis]
MRSGYHPNTAAGHPAQYWPYTPLASPFTTGIGTPSRGDTSISQRKLGIQEDLLDPPLEYGAESPKAWSQH